MIKHIVLFKFKPGVSDADRDRFVEMIRGMPARIPEIRELHAGPDVLRSERSYDVALVSSFEDLAALGRYAKHEAHQPVIQHGDTLCQTKVAVDFEF